jgi:predicted CopG family antitoxin
MHTQIIMATKTISIREEVYEILMSLKKENESFSDVIWKLTKKRKPNLRDYFGGLKDSKAIIDIKEDSKKIRGYARLRTI